jgi:23S rRNA pseudouridine1911/1915/1917 synthase
MDEISPTNSESRTSEFSVYIGEREMRRVDTYLSTLFADMSRSYVQRLIEQGFVTVNGTVVSKNAKLRARDTITMRWKVDASKFEPETMNLDIVYDSPGFAVINKDAGINVHPVPGEGGNSGTLVNGLMHHFGELSIINGTTRPGIVHRLDKDTSGLIMIAKNDVTMRALQAKIEKRTISKRYLAVVLGEIPESELYIESYIGRDPNDRKRMTAINPVAPRLAQTRAFVRERRNGYSLVEVDLLTGRTHQIRVHLSSIGFPIVGDSVYGSAGANRNLRESDRLTRQWLHAWKLSFCLWGVEYAFE